MNKILQIFDFLSNNDFIDSLEFATLFKLSIKESLEIIKKWNTFSIKDKMTMTNEEFENCFKKLIK